MTQDQENKLLYKYLMEYLGFAPSNDYEMQKLSCESCNDYSCRLYLGYYKTGGQVIECMLRKMKDEFR